ncbi:MAG: threonine/serine exporter family protein, partial [Bacillota bacterium]|nr:threonine/serine exporter family protein [Bacillota bacterium]
MYKPQEILEIAGYAAEIMMKNGGETYRVEEMIGYICSSANMENIASFVTPTGIVISLSKNGEPPETIVKRIRERGTNLEKVSLINDFSRKIGVEQWGYHEAMGRLKEVDYKKEYPHKIGIIFASGLASGAFTIFLGGFWIDVLPSIVASLIIQTIIFYSIVKDITFFSDFTGGFLAGTLGIIFIKLGFGVSLDRIVIGAIIPLVPGLAITNAVRDAIKGEL